MKYFLLFFSLFLTAQEKESFYFDFNKSNLNATQEELFFNWLNNQDKKEILEINGYCDWVGSLEYNDILAYKRINTIKAQLDKNDKIIFSSAIKIKGFGKRFKMDEIQGKNRRVDVFYRRILVKSKNFEIVDDNDFIEYADEINPFHQKVSETKIGETLILQNLNFYDRSGVIVPKSYPVLYDLYTVMRDNPRLKIEIQGHICCQLGHDNEDIGQIRAYTIYAHLINNGIEKERLSYKSFGSSKPIHKIPEKNDAERDENRRVEILIIEN